MEEINLHENSLPYVEPTHTHLSDDETEILPAVHESIEVDPFSPTDDETRVITAMSSQTHEECNNNHGDDESAQVMENNPQLHIAEAVDSGVQRVIKTDVTVVQCSNTIINNIQTEVVSPSVSPAVSIVWSYSPDNSLHRRSIDFMRRLSFAENFRNYKPRRSFSFNTNSRSDPFSPSPYRSPSPPPCCECCDSIFGVKKGPKIMC